MANPIDSQGILVTVDGDSIGCLLSIGDLVETRATNTKTCMSSNDTFTSIGAVTRDPMDLAVTYDPADALGKKGLIDAFDDKTVVVIVLTLNDSLGVSGTTVTFNANVTKKAITIPKDDSMELQTTIQIQSSWVIVPAS